MYFVLHRVIFVFSVSELAFNHLGSRGNKHSARPQKDMVLVWKDSPIFIPERREGFFYLWLNLFLINVDTFIKINTFYIG